MQDFFSDFSEWMAALPVLWAYVALLLIAYGENVLPPIPGDLVVVFGGYLVGIGKLDFVAVVVLATLGGALGFMTMYTIGLRIGDALLDPARFRFVPKDQVYKARDWINRYGYVVVAANRFLSGARSVISLTAGMAGMDAWKTALLATLSAAIWTGLIAYAGYAVGENWQIIGDYLAAYGRVVLAVTVALAVALLARWYAARARKGREGGRERGRMGEGSGETRG